MSTMFPKGLLQEYASSVSLIARCLDALCVLVAAVIAYYARFDSFELPTGYQIALLLAILLTVIIFSGTGVYTSWRGRHWYHQARIVVLSWLLVVVALILVAFLTKTSAYFSRQWMGTWTIVGMVVLLVCRLGFYHALSVMRKRGWNHKKILIVGSGELAREIAQKIAAAPWTGLDIVAFYDESYSGQTNQLFNLKIFQHIDNLEQYVAKEKINEVWLALPLKDEERMKKIIDELRFSTVNIRFVPGIFGFRLFNHSVTEVAGLPIIDLNASPMVGLNRLIKELEDRVLAFAILVVISPILLLIAFAVKISSPGPILYKQYRQGWDGRAIKIYKFRTMYVHAEENNAVTQANKNDARVTPIGAILRRLSLDELPQFFNVLQGRMSIVGPRPHAIVHNEMYKQQIDAYMLRHKVKPGITGWAQINGWRGETDTLDKMKKRVEYDLFYIENWSLWLDLRIIFLSLFKGFVGKNAY